MFFEVFGKVIGFIKIEFESNFFDGGSVFVELRFGFLDYFCGNLFWYGLFCFGFNDGGEVVGM